MTPERTVALDATTLGRYARFSLFNSPYPAHDAGRAIDLYPEGHAGEGFGGPAPSPVAGRVLATETVGAPTTSEGSREFLLVLECTAPDPVAGLAARVLHVEPAVGPGNRVEIGDSLGTLVRTGFFDPWVGAHLHVGFRPLDRDQRRASGSLPIEIAADLEELPWEDPTRVVAVGGTYAVLDVPRAPGLAGIGADGGGVVDGGFAHYPGGGLLGAPAGDSSRPVRLAGERVGHATGRLLEWAERPIRANGEPVTGLSFSCGREPSVAVVADGHGLAVGDRVEIGFGNPA